MKRRQSRDTAPAEKLRDPPRAIVLATTAAEKSPKNASFWARYRAGNWKGASADLEAVIGLRMPDHANNAVSAYFLAMAHWQLIAPRRHFGSGSGVYDAGLGKCVDVR